MSQSEETDSNQTVHSSPELKGIWIDDTGTILPTFYPDQIPLNENGQWRVTNPKFSSGDHSVFSQQQPDCATGLGNNDSGTQLLPTFSASEFAASTAEWEVQPSQAEHQSHMTVLSPVGAQNVWDNGGGANAGDIPTHRRYSLNEFGEVTSITPPIDPTVNSGFMQPVSCLPSHGFPDPTGQFPQEMEGVHGFAGDPTPFVPPHGFGPQQESWQGAMLTQPSQTSQVSFNPDPENVPLYEQQQKEQQLLYNMSS